MIDYREQILRYSYEHGLTHIASALSQADYIYELFTKELVVPYRDKIVIGKVFGAQSYTLVWKELGYVDDIDGITFIEHDKFPFVDFAEYTLGNSLGVAAGIAIANPDQMVWVNISDGALQMGNTLEAIQFIGHHKLNNIQLTVDFNGGQVTGRTEDVLDVRPVISLLESYGWDIQHDLDSFGVGCVPRAYIMNNPKGKGVKTMEENIRLWHYRKIETSEELQSLVAELRGT